LLFKLYSLNISSYHIIAFANQSLNSELHQKLPSLVISPGIANTSLFSSRASLAVIRVQDLSVASVIRVHFEIQAIISFLIGKLKASQVVHNLKMEIIAHHFSTILLYSHELDFG
jgi:hypothetical protein